MNDTSHSAESHDSIAQPLLPRVSMAWFFIAVAIVAIALGVVRTAEQGRALQGALVFTTLFIVIAAILSAGCFLIAFLFGAMERAVAPKQELPASPFSDGSLPPQIIPPRPVDGA